MHQAPKARFDKEKHDPYAHHRHRRRSRGGRGAPATAQAAYPWVTKQERIHDTVDGSSVSVSAHLYTRHTHAYRLVVIIDNLTALDAGPSHVSASFTQTCHHAGIKRHSKLTRSTSEAVEGLAFRAKAPAAVSGGVCDKSGASQRPIRVRPRSALTSWRRSENLPQAVDLRTCAWRLRFWQRSPVHCGFRAIVDGQSRRRAGGYARQTVVYEPDESPPGAPTGCPHAD